MKIFTIQLFFSILTIFCAEIHSSEVKITFYNVENLFDLRSDGSEYPLYTPNMHNWGISTVRKKISNISFVLHNLNADILGLAEVENKNSLSLLLRKHNLGSRYPYTTFAKSANSANGLAMLSSYPIISKKEHQVEYSGSFHSRPILECHIRLPLDTLVLFLCHWPSRKHPEYRRVETARKLLSLVETLPACTPYIIMGDLNSNFNQIEYTPDEAPAIQTVFNTGTFEQARFIPNFPSCITGTDNTYYNPWSRHSGVPFSYIYKGEKETIDHFLLPYSVVYGNTYTYLPQSFTVETLQGTLLRKGKPHRWQIIQTSKGPIHKGEGFSDHLPISITLSDTTYTCSLIDKEANYSFSYSREGWYQSSDKFSVERVLLQRNSTKKVLHLSGISNRNKTVVTKKCLPPNEAKYFEFTLCGKATYYIRFKYGESSWQYLRPDGMIKGSGKYTEFNCSSWETIRIPCPGNKKSITLQLKSYAQKKVALYIGTVRYTY